MSAPIKASAQPGLEWTFRVWIVLTVVNLVAGDTSILAMIVVGIPLLSARLKIPDWGAGLEQTLSKRYLTQFLILGVLILILDDVAVTTFVALIAFAFFKSSLVGIRHAKANLLVIVDGQCSLCLASVRFLYAARWQSSFRVTEFGSELASRFGKVTDSRQASTIEVLEFNELGVLKSTLTQSDGVLRLADECGPVWKAIALVLRAIPLEFRNKVYLWVAKNRFRVRGATLANCPMEFRQNAFEFFARDGEFGAASRS
jgi:predicted DCC family thiol-disulfide oxidoreductase YuxK